jgi:hypothetical protein
MVARRPAGAAGGRRAWELQVYSELKIISGPSQRDDHDSSASLSDPVRCAAGSSPNTQAGYHNRDSELDAPGPAPGTSYPVIASNMMW